jgi:hypothetical protein
MDEPLSGSRRCRVSTAPRRSQGQRTGNERNLNLQATSGRTRVPSSVRKLMVDPRGAFRMTADIFLSYKSSDRPRAETLKRWFEKAGWSVWIDRGIEIGEEWERRIDDELKSARLIVVLWGAEARHSAWVQREAELALRTNRLLQVHATGLPLLPPYDSIQGVRMQAWSGEGAHSERTRLLQAVADRLDSKPPPEPGPDPDEDVQGYRPEVSEALGLAFYYCARQLERARIVKDRGYSAIEDFEEIRSSFSAMLALLRREGESDDDREGVLHMMMNDFLDQLLLLSPDPNALQ